MRSLYEIQTANIDQVAREQHHEWRRRQAARAWLRSQGGDFSEDEVKAVARIIHHVNAIDLANSRQRGNGINKQTLPGVTKPFHQD